MNSDQRLILDLRQACSRPDVKSNRELVELARQHNRLCDDANSRLARCVFYLRRGFRGEAIRSCEQEPGLLEQIDLLNFADRAIWVDIAGQLGIHTPELFIELAVELNEAYSMHEVTKELARRNRLLNLLRRPASERLATLEALRDVDPFCSTWQQNIDILSD